MPLTMPKQQIQLEWEFFIPNGMGVSPDGMDVLYCHEK